MGGYSTIVVGTDGSETSLRAVERAAELARDAGAALIIACAYFPPKRDRAAEDVLKDEAYQIIGSAPAEDSLRRAHDRAGAAGAKKIDTSAVEGKATDVLRATVEDSGADLLVVGNRGLNTLAGRIIGSVPLDLVRHTPIDVLVVHTT